MSVEHWSGKDRGDENFPVGSVLIRRALRPHVHAYYGFARNADDIADSPTLAPADKIARLDTMEAVLRGAAENAPSAARLRESLALTGVNPAHATDLLVAFRQDAVKNRYNTWQELHHYCRHSAVPVGRYLLDLHGETTATHAGADALCTSLQILNHLQDCAADLAQLDRCYLPLDTLEIHAATIDDLRRSHATPALRAVLDELLARCDQLNQTAAGFPALVRARGLRLESAMIVALAQRLARRLRLADPLATRVKLTRTDFAGAALSALKLFFR